MQPHEAIHATTRKIYTLRRSMRGFLAGAADMARRLLDWNRADSHNAMSSANRREDMTMIRKFILLLAYLACAATSLSACNTIQGAGRDVERAGQGVQEEAREHKHY